MSKTIKRFILSLMVLLCLLFSTGADSLDILTFFKNDLKSPMLAISASYINKPKIILNGVSYEKGKGFLPKRIEFVSSDVSYYQDELLNPESVGLFGLFSTLTSNFSPLISKATEELEERGFEEGELILDGWIDIDGGEMFTLGTLMFDSDFSQVSGSVTGNVQISGEKRVSLEFSFSVEGTAGRIFIVDNIDVKINREAVKIGPIMVSLKEF